MEPLLSKEPTVAELCQEVLPFIFMSLKTKKRVVSQSEASLRPSVFWHLLYVELSVFYNHFLQGCVFEFVFGKIQQLCGLTLVQSCI